MEAGRPDRGHGLLGFKEKPAQPPPTCPPPIHVLAVVNLGPSVKKYLTSKLGVKQEWTGCPSHLLPRFPSAPLSPAGVSQGTLASLPSAHCGAQSLLQRPAGATPFLEALRALPLY